MLGFEKGREKGRWEVSVPAIGGNRMAISPRKMSLEHIAMGAEGEMGVGKKAG